MARSDRVLSLLPPRRAAVRYACQGEWASERGDACSISWAAGAGAGALSESQLQTPDATASVLMVWILTSHLVWTWGVASVSLLAGSAPPPELPTAGWRVRVIREGMQEMLAVLDEGREELLVGAPSLVLARERCIEPGLGLQPGSSLLQGEVLSI